MWWFFFGCYRISIGTTVVRRKVAALMHQLIVLMLWYRKDFTACMHFGVDLLLNHAIMSMSYGLRHMASPYICNDTIVFHAHEIGRL